MNAISPQIELSWLEKLDAEFKQSYFAQLKAFLVNEKKSNVVYPPGKEIFSAFNKTPFTEVNVVIIGQDPYHNPRQANGLCFSVAPGVKPPPSLKNIFKEIEQDMGIKPPNNGDLSKWAEQGVLLLNAVLTVRKNQPASHQKRGWETFTDAVIKKISDEKENVIFLLWGNYAKNKGQYIDTSKHHILTAAHPSPFSAHNGFFGCQHFSKTNSILKSLGKKPIHWDLNE